MFSEYFIVPLSKVENAFASESDWNVLHYLWKVNYNVISFIEEKTHDVYNMDEYTSKDARSCETILVG